MWYYIINACQHTLAISKNGNRYETSFTSLGLIAILFHNENFFTSKPSFIMQKRGKSYEITSKPDNVAI